jgi:hypothetical protein
MSSKLRQFGEIAPPREIWHNIRLTLSEMKVCRNCLADHITEKFDDEYSELVTRFEEVIREVEDGLDSPLREF